MEKVPPEPPKLSPDRIEERLFYIDEQVAILRRLRDEPGLLEALPKDKLDYGGALYALQSAIQAMIDIAFHVCAKLYLRAPENSAEAFELLAEKGELPDDFLPSIREMVNFRNLVVHGYLHTKTGVVMQIIRENLDDFTVWRRLVDGMLRRNGARER